MKKQKIKKRYYIHTRLPRFLIAVLLLIAIILFNYILIKFGG